MTLEVRYPRYGAEMWLPCPSPLTARGIVLFFFPFVLLCLLSLSCLQFTDELWLQFQRLRSITSLYRMSVLDHG